MRLLIALIAAALLTLSAFAAETSAGGPAGDWKWTAHGPMGSVEVEAKLTYTDKKLAGVIIARGTEAPITETSFENNVMMFTVVREAHGLKINVNYSGKLEGDTITGTIDRPKPGTSLDSGEREQVEWIAKRAAR